MAKKTFQDMKIAENMERLSEAEVKKYLKACKTAFKKAGDKNNECEGACGVDKCRWFGHNCWKTCGIVMKHLHNSGQIVTNTQFGTPKTTSEVDFYSAGINALDDEHDGSSASPNFSSNNATWDSGADSDGYDDNNN